jgi:hypothetical protein
MIRDKNCLQPLIRSIIALSQPEAFTGYSSFMRAGGDENDFLSQPSLDMCMPLTQTNQPWSALNASQVSSSAHGSLIL